MDCLRPASFTGSKQRALSNAHAQPHSEPERTQGARKVPSGATLTVYGALIGCYLLYSWVWFSWAQFYGEVNTALAEPFGPAIAAAYLFMYWLTPAAPALWWLTVTVMHPVFSRKHLLWLAIGLVVLVPLPFFFTQGGLF